MRNSSKEQFYCWRMRITQISYLPEINKFLSAYLKTQNTSANCPCANKQTHSKWRVHNLHSVACLNCRRNCVFDIILFTVNTRWPWDCAWNNTVLIPFTACRDLGRTMYCVCRRSRVSVYAKRRRDCHKTTNDDATLLPLFWTRWIGCYC